MNLSNNRHKQYTDNRSRNYSKKNQTTTFITLNHEIIPETETITFTTTSQQNYRSSTLKYQKQIKQVHSTETQPDPPGIDNTENSELQSNHTHCESTDEENETEKMLSQIMFYIENE